MSLKRRLASDGQVAMGDPPPAVVISAGGSPGALDMVRSLRMAGISSCVMSSQRNDIAFRSRGCVKRIHLPPFEAANHREIATILLKYGQAYPEKPVLFYASDPELKFVWMFREVLEPVFRFLLPPDDMFESLLNKVLFGTYAAQNGLPVPTAVQCADVDEVVARIEEIPFPCIVKPAFSEHWSWKTDELWEKFGPYKSALRKFTSAGELIEFCTDLPSRKDGFIIQKYVEGRDESIFSFHGYFDGASNCLGSFIGCKIRTYPMHTGGSTYIRTLHHERLSSLSVSILRSMKFRGIVKIDFKQDPQTGEFYVLEINSRYNLWQLLGSYAGMNLAALAFHHQRGRQVRMPGEYKDDLRLIYAKQDVRSFVKGYWKSGEWTLRSYLLSLKGRKCFRVWDQTDPLPFLFSAMAFCFRNVARLIGRTRPVKVVTDPPLSVPLHQGTKQRNTVEPMSLAHTSRIEQ